MEATLDQIVKLVEGQRQFFSKGTTKDVDYRISQLKRLKSMVDENADLIMDTLQKDLGRCRFESYASEIAFAKGELEFAIKHLKDWAKPEKVSTPLVQQPGSSYIHSEPRGNVLIIGTWNYPFQLVSSPLVGALAAGNTAVIKPSEVAPHSSALMADLVKKTFGKSYVAVVEGGAETTTHLLVQKFDHIFYTGGGKVGRVVMEAAAKHLTPVTLELGGKSPCIVTSDVDMDVAARRVVWGKFFNAGQTCVAPDYLLVQESIKDKFVEKLKETITQFYGADPKTSPDFARIINERHFDRLMGLLKGAPVLAGGDSDRTQKYLAPTLVDKLPDDAALMGEEIFGPILPVIGYNTLQDAVAHVNSRPKPLALYVFSKDTESQDYILQHTSSGGVCINDTMVHMSTTTLPFGGVGESGFGNYHGKASFDAFSHKRSVMKRSMMGLTDVKQRYAPYTEAKFKFLKRMLG